MRDPSPLSHPRTSKNRNQSRGKSKIKKNLNTNFYLSKGGG